METLQPKFNTASEKSPGTFEEEQLPIFEGNFEKKVEQIIGWMNEHIKVERWNEDKIKNEFALRSAKDILTDGTVFYMNPCNDFTLVSYALLKKNGFKPTLVSETFENSTYPIKIVNMHFALEFKIEQELYFLEFETMNQVQFKKGPYVRKNTNNIDNIKIQKTGGEIKFNYDMEKALKFNGLDTISGQELEKVKGLLIMSNTDTQEAKYRDDLAKLPGENKLYLNKELD